MMDFSKQTVKVECSKCKRSISVTLKQIADEVLIKCTCGQGIQLTDSNGSTKKGINDTSKALSDLEKALKKLGR